MKPGSDVTSQNIEGIYFKIKLSTIGTGATQRNVRAKIFCEAREIGNGEVEVRYLGFNGRPSGISDVLGKRDFLKDFIYCSATYQKNDDPKKRSVEKHLAMADGHFKRKEYFAAEYEYGNALRLDEGNVRAAFGKGLSLIERGEQHKAKEIFTNLARIEALFLEENKHLFNEFGIRLRKLNLCNEAIRHYQKAITIGPDDEHLYFNLSRAYSEIREMEQARKWVQIALKTDPTFQEAKDLLKRIENTHPGDTCDHGSGEG